MGADEEGSTVASPRLRRQRSAASAVFTRCCTVLCCYDCDNFFTPLPPSTPPSARSPSPWQYVGQAPARPARPWRPLGSRTGRIAMPAHGDAEHAAVMEEEDLYVKPARWRIFFRKLRSEARQISWSRPSSLGFHYDALSYSMNFDDGNWLHRSPSPISVQALPSAKLQVSDVL